jgi:hypothetical protein
MSFFFVNAITFMVPFDFFYMHARHQHEIWVPESRHHIWCSTVKCRQRKKIKKQVEDQRDFLILLKSWNAPKKGRERRRKKNPQTHRDCFPSHENHKMTTKWLWCSFRHSAISFLLLPSFVAVSTWRKNLFSFWKEEGKKHYIAKHFFMLLNLKSYFKW